MNVVLDFKGLVSQYLAPHRRQPNRLGWLWGLVDLQQVFDDFASWRRDTRYRLGVCGQRMTLEEFLADKYGEGIRVLSYDDGLWGIGLSGEPAHWLPVSLSGEEGVLAPIPLAGEAGEGFDGFDFLVLIPKGYDTGRIRAEIGRYKLAGKRYKIKSI